MGILDLTERLQRLVGQRLWKANRSLNLQVFHFGDRLEVTDRKGRSRETSSQALHLQGAWRILKDGKVLVGARDRMTPRGNPAVVPDGFTWNEPRSTLCDEKLELLFEERASHPLCVTQVTCGAWGAFCVELTDGYALEVFPDNSTGEQWRHIDRRAADTSQHFVFPEDAIALA